MSTSRLIADIGGTNARFALLDGSEWRDERVLACADYPDIVSAIEDYLKSAGAASGSARPTEGALAIAGPITGDIVRMTNHVWQFSAARTREALKWRRLIMVNDFTALAMAIRHLAAERAGADRRRPTRDRRAAGAARSRHGTRCLGIDSLRASTGFRCRAKVGTSRCP